MRSLTSLLNLYQNLTLDSSTANQTLGTTFINDSIKLICTARDWDFSKKQASLSTVALQQFYDLPNDYDQLIDTTITVGTTKYTPRECPSQERWDFLNEVTSFSSNFPEWFFILNGRIGFYPTPSASGNTITLTYRRKVVDLQFTDYTTGTLDIVTNGSNAVTGAGSSWTASMIGRWLKITPDAAVAKNGDGYWYQIATVPSSTTLTLVKNYQGTSMTTGAGAAYTIGEMSIIPEAYMDLPAYEAAVTYFITQNPDSMRATNLKEVYAEKYAQLVYDHSVRTSNPVVEKVERVQINPNLTVTF